MLLALKLTVDLFLKMCDNRLYVEGAFYES